MFGEQFVNFAYDIQGPLDEFKSVRLKRNLSKLKNDPSNFIQFPEYNGYPYHLREVFEYYKGILHKEDILAFAQGTLYKENIINVYFRILEKVNMILQSSFNFQRATIRNSIDPHNQTTPTQQPLKVLYFNTNFHKKLNSETYLKDCLSQLREFYKYDSVVMPFFFNEEDDQRALIVLLNVATCTVDLFDRERETDNHDISDTIIHMIDLASKISEVEFSEDQIDGGVEGICVSRDEDMLVAMCYIAECHTFNRPIDLEVFSVKQERQRIVDTLLALLEFQ